MWDASWTDPTRETVGQRKNRKEIQQFQESSVPRSAALESALALPKRPSLRTLFNGSKIGKSSQAHLHPSPSAVRSDDSSQSTARLSSDTCTVTSAQELHDATTTRTMLTTTTTRTTNLPIDRFLAATSHDMTETEVSARSDGSIFSGWSGRSCTTDSSWGSISTTGTGSVVQPLSPTSFVIQSTEVTVSPRESFHVDDQIATVVHISSAASSELIDEGEEAAKTFTSNPRFEFRIPNFDPSNRSVVEVLEGTASQPISWPMATTTEQPECWRPPPTWECHSDDTSELRMRLATVSTSTEPPFRRADSNRRGSTPSELMHLRKNLRRMESASSKIVLERLKEEWLEVADGAVYRELELEKQLWMLTVLRTLNKKKMNGNPDERKIASTLTKETSLSSKVLSLYENHASSSFLAALSVAPEIHHLSTHPLSPKSYPNVYPLAVPGPTPQLPYASNIFTSIHSFGLPCLFPSSSIPAILKECHRALTSSSISAHCDITKAASTKLGGTLHLTILDPSPLPSTMGPLLRAWLDNHLLVNLEKQFRCINPGRLLPILLADAGLRGEGSTIVGVKFMASIQNRNGAVSGDASVKGSGSGTEEVTEELKSVMGRMLWKEMWSSFVEGEKWWWEDESVVEECERLETCWEYFVVEAVKEG